MPPKEKFELPGAVWSLAMPSAPGDFWMMADECEGEPELVHIETKAGLLWCIDCEIGSLPVRHYHEGLSNCCWQTAILAVQA